MNFQKKEYRKSKRGNYVRSHKKKKVAGTEGLGFLTKRAQCKCTAQLNKAHYCQIPAYQE